ncbi:MAG: hypothetical protein IPP66_08305 [Anaerolineales bacterium]|nr:hypothetical protein [Anaerolineales bacterium]
MKTRIILILVALLLSACGANNTEITPTVTPETKGRLPFPFITDVNRYSEVMESITPKTVIEHFPESVPSEASNVKFAYQPRIMQGAMFLELLMTLPESQINELQVKYGDLEQYHYSEEKGLTDIPEPILYLINDESTGFAQNFSIFLISAQPAGSEDFIWNHGTMYGVGLNKTTSQVIYWFQYW